MDEQTPHPGVWHMNIAKLGAHEFLDKPWRWLHTLPFLAPGFDYEDDEGEVQFRDGVQSAEITSLFLFTERWIHGRFNTNELSMDTYMMSFDVLWCTC